MCSGGHGRVYAQYTCDEGKHNPLATLYMSNEEGAIKHLYSYSGGMPWKLLVRPMFTSLLVGSFTSLLPSSFFSGHDDEHMLGGLHNEGEHAEPAEFSLSVLFALLISYSILTALIHGVRIPSGMKIRIALHDFFVCFEWRV